MPSGSSSRNSGPVRKVALPDESVIEVAEGTTVGEAAARISEPLARAAVAAKVSLPDRPPQVVELDTPIEHDCRLKILTLNGDDPDTLEVLRHSAAHVMAQAICELFPQTELVYGPTVEDGFYYDIDLDRPLTPEDFAQIEERMHRIVEADLPFRRYELPREEAMAKLRTEGNRYKIDNAERAVGDRLSFYVTGRAGEDGFEDLCRGPHVPSTGRIGAFKVMQVSGAYYRGDAREKMLQRVYGTAWASQKALDAYLHRLEEAKKRDHRVLGKQLDLYSVQEDIGAGLVHWHPKGAMIRHLVEDFWRREHLKRGYQLVYTPHIASRRIFDISGHLEKYADMMYSPMDIDGEDYYVRPMNCPGHYRIYQSSPRSYRDLPIRYAELGTVYRYERSGTLHGLLRVRMLTMDDGHLFCTPDQVEGELDLLLELMDFMMRSFGYTYEAYLATRPEQYLGTVEEWDSATEALRQALIRRGLEFEVDEGAGVFYAPKIDIKLIDSIGREWQGPTHQLDLQAARRFGITYVGPDNALHETAIIHRTVLGSMERFIGGLIEHYAGAFPLWLAPIQVAVVTVSARSEAYARRVHKQLTEAGLRVELDVSSDKIGPKKHRARHQRIPYILVVGEREAADETVNVNDRDGHVLGNMPVPELVARCRGEIEGMTSGHG